MARQRTRTAAPRHPRPPLDRAALEALAVAYAARYATSRARLADYLRRKLRERGWTDGVCNDGGDGDGKDGAAAPPVDAIVAACAALGYVDDRGFARMTARSLTARGFGARRVRAALDQSGIAAAIRDDTLAYPELAHPDGDTPDADADPYAARLAAAHDAAHCLARRKRFGPYRSSAPADAKATARRELAAMLRGGHPPDVARAVLNGPARDGF